MPENNGTKTLLKELLADLYRKADKEGAAQPRLGDSYLIADDGQFLGRITANRYDTESLLNKYGPYGSPYSHTSIFNKYGPYGSRYSLLSPHNPYSLAPPILYLNGDRKGRVTANPYLVDRIPVDDFESALRNNIAELLRGHLAIGRARPGR